MNSATVDVKELAALKGCSVRYVQKIASNGELPVIESMNSKNRKTYLFPVEQLPVELKTKYYRQVYEEKRSFREDIQTEITVGGNAAAYGISERADTRFTVYGTPGGEVVPGKAFDEFTESERREIEFWLSAIEEWQDWRGRRDSNKAEADELYVTYLKGLHPELSVSVATLYRKQKSIKEGKLGELPDGRGKPLRGRSRIPEKVWDVFLSFYLDEAKHPVLRCIEYTRLWCREYLPEIVDDIPEAPDSFYRHIKTDVSEAVKVLGRDGEKAFRDRCAPYIQRTYDDMLSNEWWIADNHTFDVITSDGDGKRHRLYLTAFFDARSGIFTGSYITDAPCSQATLAALRNGILKYGIPDNIYVDNGREFLTFDVGGLGHRKKKAKDGKEEFTPPPIFKRLGIEMTNAIVRNAKAKIIERRFCDVKNQLSKLFSTYTGGTVTEKPECLKGILKDGQIPVDEHFKETVDTLLEWYFNQQPYGGAVRADRGKARIDVYYENRKKVRKASEGDLALMLMRSSKPQTVGRRGVHLDIAGKRLNYWNDALLASLLGKQVYYRYDPEELSSVRIYDLEDRYIMTVPCDNTAVLEYGADKDRVKAAMGKVRQFEKITKASLEASIVPAIGKDTACDLILADAMRKKQGFTEPEPPKVVQMQRVTETPLIGEAVGCNIDFERMNKNAYKKNGGKDK